MNTIEGYRNRIHSWCPDIEEGAMNQMKVIADLPFVRHCALMPDAHLGKGMPVGGVVACDGVVVPLFVGVDIGCGIVAVQTSIKRECMTEEVRAKVLHGIGRGIPVGFNHNDEHRARLLEQSYGEKYNFKMDKIFGSELPENSPFPGEDLSKLFFGQLGTLGSGNHFAEVQYDENSLVWVMIHSGSRNMGLKIGDLFNKKAAELNAMWYSSTPKEIPFLPVTSDMGRDYLKWMEFALYFAFLNRSVMMEEAMRELSRVFPGAAFEKPINIHHNYASLERRLGHDVWVHRKGATLASEGNVGIIPGSMGSSSYITTGLGNKMSLCSSSHGAGRRMGRMEFNRQYNTAEGMQEISDSLSGVVHSPFRKGENRKGKETGLMDVSEAPQAYKDIDTVMANQTDLVGVLHTLKPLLCLKG